MRNRTCLAAILAIACQGPPTARGQGADDALRVPAGFKIAVYVGLLVLPDGSLLVSDDYGGKIWRVSYGR